MYLDEFCSFSRGSFDMPYLAGVNAKNHANTGQKVHLLFALNIKMGK